MIRACNLDPSKSLIAQEAKIASSISSVLVGRLPKSTDGRKNALPDQENHDGYRRSRVRSRECSIVVIARREVQAVNLVTCRVSYRGPG